MKRFKNGRYRKIGISSITNDILLFTNRFVAIDNL